jgi:two-component system chemotaxis sensor kinase CheA
VGELRYLLEYVEDEVQIVEVGAADLHRLRTGSPDPPEPHQSPPERPEPGGPETGPEPEPGPVLAEPHQAAARPEARALKVAHGTVDHLLELANELTVTGNALTFLASTVEETRNTRAAARRIKDHHAAQHRIVQELHAVVMELRLVPVSAVLAALPRLVRDLGRRLGKSVDLVLAGEQATADKDIVETLADPLAHLVRNALDHGIEPEAERVRAGKRRRGEIRISAASDGYALVIEVSDDGRGIDHDLIRRTAVAGGVLTERQADQLDDAGAVELAFRAGVSTATEVSEVSGRGVGMDAVRAGVARMGGDVTLASEPGRGTTVRLRLPVSMAMTRLMVVSVAGQRFGVPLDAVVETVRAAPGDVTRLLDGDAMVLRGDVLPIVDLPSALELPGRSGPDEPLDILVVRGDRAATDRVGLRVERFHRDVEAIVRPVDGVLAGHRVVSGTALLGDGLVLLVLNVPEILAAVG